MEGKLLIIMRGLPWTGKSYRAKELAGDTGIIFSTDEFWYKIRHPEKPEEYSFNPRYLGEAHNWNQKRTQRQIELGHPLIIVDNTNTTAQEFCCQYAKYAYCQGYEVLIEEPTSDRWKEIRELLLDKKSNKNALKKWAETLATGSRETHNVPQWSIERMMWRWECNLDMDLVIEECLEQHQNSDTFR